MNISIWRKLQNYEISTLGESWIGLDKLHQLTSERSYSLKITMTDYDNKTFVAVYDYFKVSHSVSKFKSNSNGRVTMYGYVYHVLKFKSNSKWESHYV